MGVIADLEALLLHAWDAADRLDGHLRGALHHLDVGDEAALLDALAAAREAGERCAALVLARDLVTAAATGRSGADPAEVAGDDDTRAALLALREVLARVEARRAELVAALGDDVPRRSALGAPRRA